MPVLHHDPVNRITRRGIFPSGGKFSLISVRRNYLYDGSGWMVKYHMNRGWQYRPLRQALRNAARRAA
ncbi:hypothetical protein IH92_12685 [Salmonella enterica]|nr:hypothetical protein [Salmonella enterica]